MAFFEEVNKQTRKGALMNGVAIRIHKNCDNRSLYLHIEGCLMCPKKKSSVPGQVKCVRITPYPVASKPLLIEGKNVSTNDRLYHNLSSNVDIYIFSDITTRLIEHRNNISIEI